MTSGEGRCHLGLRFGNRRSDDHPHAGGELTGSVTDETCVHCESEDVADDNGTDEGDDNGTGRK